LEKLVQLTKWQTGAGSRTASLWEGPALTPDESNTISKALHEMGRLLGSHMKYLRMLHRSPLSVLRKLEKL
jgi:hypothetical protein